VKLAPTLGWLSWGTVVVGVVAAWFEGTLLGGR
jgi:hypothetical protein